MNSWNDNDYRKSASKEVKPLTDIDYDRMSWLEQYTPFDFSTTDKTISLVKGVGSEATQTAVKVGGFFDNVFSGLNNLSKFFKYLPLLVVAYFGMKLFTSSKASA